MNKSEGFMNEALNDYNISSFRAKQLLELNMRRMLAFWSISNQVAIWRIRHMNKSEGFMNEALNDYSKIVGDKRI